MSGLSHRIAGMDNLPAVAALIERAMAELMDAFLSPEQVAASYAIMGLDTALIADGTYFMVFADGVLAGCGGWSRRETMYGGDTTSGRSARLLDPATEPARVRAMYTDPAFVRRGVGRCILALCEAAAASEGFTRAELAATMPGKPLYEACGYRVIEAFDDARGGAAVPLARMGKTLG